MTIKISRPACAPGCCPDGCRDPYYLFEQWCRANGYQDVYDDEPGRVSLARLDEAVARYAESNA
jgi:hypothetical protein